MFLHLFKYKLKEILRSWWALGWTLVFPIVLSTAFYLGFGNMMKEEPDVFNTIPVALVSEKAGPFTEVLKAISESTDDKPLFKITEATKEEAAALLSERKVEGIFTDNGLENPEVQVLKSGIDQSIMTEFIRSYLNNSSVIMDLMQSGKIDMASVKEVSEQLSSDTEIIKPYSFKEDQISPWTNYFFALIAMSSLFGSWVSMAIMQGICANQSENGKRYECSPAPKFISIAAGTFAGLVVQLFSNIMIVLYIENVLKISFGAQPLYVLIVITLGGAIGTTSGIALNSFFGRNKVLSIVVPLAFTMISSFLSGLMFGSMKQVVEMNCPFLNRINPAAVIADALYSAGVYGIGSRYWTNVIILAVMVAVFTITGAVRLRGRSYDSI